MYTSKGLIMSSHEAVSHSKWFIDLNSDVYTNAIEATYFAIKISILYRRKTKKLIKFFLVRYCLFKIQNSIPFIAI